VNFKVEAENMGLQEEVYLEILDLFIKASARNLSQLRSALQTGNGSKILHETHSLKGAALNLGFWEICEIVEKIAMRVRGNVWVGISDEVELIQGKIDQIAALLEKKRRPDESRRTQGLAGE
jgi:HPt (histidine-containing phosphotransfer) domain-containing protein